VGELSPWSREGSAGGSKFLPSPVVLRSLKSDRRWRGCRVSSCGRGRGENGGKDLREMNNCLNSNFSRF
jgi:hypothetical protein